MGELRAVSEFAAKEFELHGSLAQLALTFPPRTVFDSDEHFASTLAALGLCPSATLLVKALPTAHLAEAEAAAQQQPIAEAEPQLAAAAPPGGLVKKCPIGHPMVARQMTDEGWCDNCSEALPIGSEALECAACDFYLCPACGVAQ